MIRNKKIAELLGATFNVKSDPIHFIWIYSEQKSERLLYTCDFIFRHFLKIEFKIITQLDGKLNDGNPVINYSKNTQAGGIQIQPEGLLFETGIRKNIPEFRKEKDKFCLFPGKIGT